MCSGGIARLFLVAINIVFFIAGLTFLVLGGLAGFKPDLLLRLLSLIPADILNDINEQWDLSKFLVTSAVPLMIIGAVMFGVSFFGCCGAVKESRFLLSVYMIIIGVILVTQIAAGIFIRLKSNSIDENVRHILKKTLTQHYTNASGGMNIDGMEIKVATNPLKLAWDGAQIMLQCCGTENASDYSAAGFSGQYNFSGGVIASKVPLSCCHAVSQEYYERIRDAGNASLSKQDLLSINNCLTEGPGVDDVNQQGCYNSLLDLIKDNLLTFVYVVAGVIGVELLAFICSWCIYQDGKKA